MYRTLLSTTGVPLIADPGLEQPADSWCSRFELWDVGAVHPEVETPPEQTAASERCAADNLRTCWEAPALVAVVAVQSVHIIVVAPDEHRPPVNQWPCRDASVHLVRPQGSLRASL